MDIIKATIREWRELGFHYDRNDDRRVWTITGSRTGIGRFSGLLRKFAADIRNDLLYEHDHYGPYCYLKIMNVPSERGFNSNAICAPRLDFEILADIVDSQTTHAKTGDTFGIKQHFCPDSEYNLNLSVMDDDFDPGMFDSWVKEKISEQNDASKPDLHGFPDG
ncbi:MAG: hypothetical protein ABL888_10135 [Pirellulaceae bacterium]